MCKRLFAKGFSSWGFCLPIIELVITTIQR
nr:unnamed protein product [Callosobruchus analis]